MAHVRAGAVYDDEQAVDWLATPRAAAVIALGGLLVSVGAVDIVRYGRSNLEWGA